MASEESFYSGGKTAMQRGNAPFSGYHINARDLAYPSDPFTANQIQAVSKKISSGTGTVEISGINLSAGGMKNIAAVPKEHWGELAKLSKLTGVDFTFHGPLVEPTGVGRAGWSEDQRKEAETQMRATIEAAHAAKPNGNIVVTFHASNNIEEVKRFVRNDKGQEELARFAVVNERTGEMGQIPLKEDYLTPEKSSKFSGKNQDEVLSQAKAWLKVRNEDAWTGQLSNISLEAARARNVITQVFENDKLQFTPEIYKEYMKSPDKFEKSSKKIAMQRTEEKIAEFKQTIKDKQQEELNQITPNILNQEENNIRKEVEKSKQNLGESDIRKLALQRMNEKIDELKKASAIEQQKEINQITPKILAQEEAQIKKFAESAKADLGYADAYLRQTYLQVKEQYNEAFQKADSERKKELDKIRDILAPAAREFDKDKSTIYEFEKALSKSIDALKTIGAPEYYRPLEEFAVDKASESFSNVAIFGVKTYKDSAPIISIENPPAGMAGLTRADEIKKLIEVTRDKFVQKAQTELNMSEKEARAQAEKTIGATWDVGHINSIRKWGYKEEDVIAQAKTIGPYVKHMHLADNLGFEDAELPMGMGNVPLGEILKTNVNFRNAKKTIETGDWYNRAGLGMTSTPARESMSSLGSPFYSMGQAADSPYWTNNTGVFGAYSGGLGPINPEIHHSIYSGGFSNLPSSLGAEIPGLARNSSFSGNPLE